MSSRKCQAKEGVINCRDPHCPEKTSISDLVLPSFYKPEAFPRVLTPTPGAWTEADTVLFKTVHGSRLYGLNHKDSDEDFYVITPTRKVSRKINAKQTIVGDQDVTALDFKSFVSLSHKGVPQALEAMFSRASKSDFFEDYRQNYYASDGEVIHTYMKTIKSFSMTEKDPFKRKRHALRLSLNLEELMYTGRFNPTLNQGDVLKITRLAHKEGLSYYKELAAICPIELNWEEEYLNPNRKGFQ